MLAHADVDGGDPAGGDKIGIVQRPLNRSGGTGRDVQVALDDGLALICDLRAARTEEGKGQPTKDDHQQQESYNGYPTPPSSRLGACGPTMISGDGWILFSKEVCIISYTGSIKHLTFSSLLRILHRIC